MFEMPAPKSRSRTLGLASIWTSVIKLLKIIFPYQSAAWAATSEPIKRLLDEPDGEEKDRLTALWRDSAQSQLNAICITSALFGGVIASSFTWSALGTLSRPSQSTVLAVWYSALVLALASIAASAQQAVALNRLNSYSDGLAKIRNLLGRYDGDGGVWRVSKMQLFVWQTPISMLNSSIVMFAVGLAVLVWSSVDWGWAWSDIKIVLIFMLTLVYASFTYLLTAYGLYTT